jgi:NAD(P)-dependent dehydrogenase (short-subunit alcohol dehydrogenase family)
MKKPEVVVVTGASAGVGRATVRKLAAQGAHIGLLARGRAGLEGARREVEELGGRALVLPTDVSKPEEVEMAADAVERELGPIDVWINCAMVTIYSPIAELSAAEVRRVTEVGYLGYVHGTMSALSRMRQRDRGKIVQVSSSLAFRGIPLQAPYCAAKAAIRGFTDSLIAELRHEGSRISVSMVHLPAVDTPQFDWALARTERQPMPVPPIFAPEVAADAIVWAAHHDRRELTVTASAMKLVLLGKAAPSALDRYLGKKGYDMQQSDRLLDPNRATNLWEPVSYDAGAHGSYGEKAKQRSPMLWLAEHRSAAVGALVGALALGTAVALAARG